MERNPLGCITAALSITYRPTSSSKRLHQFPNCWQQFSWCCPEADWGVPMWHQCRSCSPFLESSRVLSPTSGAGSYTAWAEWFQSHEASQYNEPPTPLSHQSPSAVHPALEYLGIILGPHWEGPKLSQEKMWNVTFLLFTFMDRKQIRMQSVTLTGPLPWSLCGVDREGVELIQMRLQVSHGHSCCEVG